MKKRNSFMKRIMALILSMIMVIGLIPNNLMSVWAETSETQEQGSAYFIKNNYMTNSFLYDDNGTLRFSTLPNSTDTKYQWVVEIVGSNKAIKNVSTGNYINVSGCAIDWNGTVHVSTLVEGDNDYLWSFDLTAGTFISSISNPGANISMATSENFPERTQVECRNDGAATWGTSKWDFVLTSDYTPPVIPPVTPSTYYIKNNYMPNSYLYDDNGTLRFGNPENATDTRYQWLVEDKSGNKAIKNVSTSNYINVSGCEINWNGTVKVSTFVEGDNDYLWNFDITAGTFISSVSNQGANISMATSENFPERTEVECRNDGAATWGTSKWDFVLSSDFIPPVSDSAYYIKNNYKEGAYLYDDNGILKFGQPTTATDTRYQWDIEDKGIGKALKNVSSSNFITVSGSAISWNGTVHVSPFVEGENDYLWNFDAIAGTYISSVSNEGANLSIATSENFPDRREVECRNDGAATWGTSKWDFIQAKDFVAPESNAYVTIQNSYYQLYMVEDTDGSVIYGNTKRSNEYAQWLIKKDANNLYSIQNKATGHYVLPVAGTNKLHCVDSENPYYWTKEQGNSGIVFGDSIANAGIGENETYIQCIHMENKKGFIENSQIQKNWGTPQWIVSEYKEVNFTFIKAKDTGLYLYEDADSNIKAGTINTNDSSFYWSVDTSSEISYIKNRKTGHNITIEHIYQAGDRSLPLIGMTGEPSWSSIKWKVVKVDGEENTYTIESGWDWFNNCIIHHLNPDDGNVYCNDTGAVKSDDNAKWIFETAPELVTEVTIPTDNIRIKSSSTSNYLYEIQSSKALVYGGLDASDLRSHWLIEASGEGGFYKIKNRVSGRYITADNNLSYLQCLEGDKTANGALWEVTFADGTENILLRNKLNPLNYINIGAGAGYSQSTLVSNEAGTTRWVMEIAPAEGVNPENGGDMDIVTTTIGDTNEYYVKHTGKFLTINQGALTEVTEANDNAIWQVSYYNGEARVIHKNTGKYLYNQDNTLSVKLCTTIADQQSVGWAKAKMNDTLSLTSGSLNLSLIKAKTTAVYDGSKAIQSENGSSFTVFTSKTEIKSVKIAYISSAATSTQVKVNGIVAGNLQFINTNGASKSKAFDLSLKKGINTITFLPLSGTVIIDKLQMVDVNTEYRGATSTYTQYEAEQNVTNAEVLADSRTYREFMSEASGRQGVRLNNTGDYIEFTLQEATNSLVLRYCIPDSLTGGGINSTLSLYVNGVKQNTLDLTSTYSWVYGSYPWSNTPDDKPHRFFDDSRFLFETTYPAGTTIRLQKDDTDTAAYYIIDLAETEFVEPAATQPTNSLSITSFGAIPGDGLDDTDALLECITEASKLQKEVWIPEGIFDFTRSESIVIAAEGITIRGAGMWHTTLQGLGAGFMIKADNVSFYDFSILGAETGRNDALGRAGFETSDQDVAHKNLTIQNIWMEHLKVGVWTYFMDHMQVVGCRIRNTYADGINLCGGTSNSILEQNQIRNTGDDAIALWSSATYQLYDTNNIIRFNTVGLQWLANSIALYGGRNNIVTDNIVHDTVGFGAGINISANHNPIGFDGSVTIERNTLLRCGGHEYNYNQDYGAIWIYPLLNMNVDILLKNNEVYDSSYQGISVIGGHNVKSITLLSNIIDSCGTWGIDIAAGNTGNMTLTNIIIRGNMINSINNGSPSGFHMDSLVDNALAETINPTSVITATSDGIDGWITIPGTSPTPVPPVTITPVKDTNKEVSSASITQVSTKANVFTGKAICPKVTVEINGIILVENVDYTVTYKNNKKPGIAEIIITGKGSFSGTQTITFIITPSKVKSVKLTSTKGDAATLSWDKVTGVSGYQVLYSTSKKGNYKLLATTKKCTTTKTGLTKGKTYYFKIRAYKIIDDKKIYGEYSLVQSIKVQ